MTQPLGLTLTGFMRFQIIKEWHKRGSEGNKEDFVKKVCDVKGIVYTPPIKVTREI